MASIGLGLRVSDWAFPVFRFSGVLWFSGFRVFGFRIEGVGLYLSKLGFDHSRASAFRFHLSGLIFGFSGFRVFGFRTQGGGLYLSKEVRAGIRGGGVRRFWKFTSPSLASIGASFARIISRMYLALLSCLGWGFGVWGFGSSGLLRAYGFGFGDLRYRD